MAPAVISFVVLVATWMAAGRDRARVGRIRWLLPSTVGTLTGLVIAVVFLSPPFSIVDSTILLRPLAEDTIALGLAAGILLVIGLAVHLGVRRLDGSARILALAAAPISASLLFLGLQQVTVAYQDRTEASRRFGDFAGDVKADVVVTGSAQVTRLVSGLKFVSSLTSDSAGRVIYAEFQTGEIGVVEPSADGGFENRIITDVPLPKTKSGWQGLWHVLLDPTETFLYASAVETVNPIRDLYSAKVTSGHTGRVVRFPYNDGRVGPMKVFLSGLPIGTGHGGGAMSFGPDGDFYLTLGDADAPLLSQVPGSLVGSILRFTPDGRIPSDNPVVWSPVYAYGFRNPYGMAHNAETGSMYVVDNGPRCCDRLVRVERGKFHGWPQYGQQVSDIHLQRDDAEVVSPLLDLGDRTVAPTQLVAYLGERYGAEFDGNLFFGTFAEGAIHRVVLSDDGTQALSDEIIWKFDPVKPIIGVTVGRDGYIYFSTNSEIYRVDSIGSAN